jgi:tetratricopeptide (TPR) repeat protein/tRNA A-37 threonylcarbamoyl transferase component Bud32
MAAPLGTVSHYELLRRVGAGGMGEVYLAHDTVLERQVAIKLLHASNADSDEIAERLRREAQASASLEHPNICAIYEVGTDAAGRSFIAMQYVEGETLAARLKRGPLTVSATLDLISGVTDALDAAHARGVIHRDLKPQNIIVTPSGAPKLLDFGIASVRREPEKIAGNEPTTLFSTLITGTPPYMAPEVLQGSPADARSDLFSLGVVLYECLTGISPFQGVTPQDIWGRVLHVAPEPPSRRNTAVGPELDALCARLLAKEPGARFQSAPELRGALQVLRTQQSFAPVPPAGPRKRRAGVAVAFAVALALTVGGGLWLLYPTPLPAPPPAAALWYARGIEAARQGEYLSARRALEESVRLYPDYALAYSGLAEVHAALDDERNAQAALIRVSVLVPNQARLPREDRLRLDAIRAMVLRDFNLAVAAYTALVELRPSDAGGLVDLGRALEAAGRLVAARDAYERATKLDDQFGVAFLRLGSVLGDLGLLDEALRAFDAADRLYALASNDEGQVEALLQRGAKLDAAGRYPETAKAADEAARRSTHAGLLAHELRATFLRSSAHIGAGAFAEGEATARVAVSRAIDAGLQSVAADGLIDLAGTLLASGRTKDSEDALERATAIAQDRSLTRTAMRAATQRAAVKQQIGQPREALALLEAPLAYFAEARYRRLHAVALTIAARAHQDLGDFARAEDLLGEVLAFATESGNDELVAQARSSLATVAANQGRLLEAVEHRMVAVDLRRGLRDAEILPYDLTNLTEVLIRLGRSTDAERVLVELDEGIASGSGAFPTRARRVKLLRALLAMANGKHDAARDFAGAVDGATPAGDETGQLAAAVRAAAAAMLGSRSPLPWKDEPDAAVVGWREVRLWRAVAALETRQYIRADQEARALTRVASATGGAEFRWRALAVGGAAAAHRESPDAPQLARSALEQFETVRAELGASAAAYAARNDVSRMLTAVRVVVEQSGATPPE